MNKYCLIFFGSLFLSLVQTKEILFEGDYFSSERDLANHLYFKQEFKTLILLTLDSIEQERSCDFLEPFIQVSIRTAYQLNDFQLLKYLYLSSKSCNSNDRIINEIYIKYLAEIEEYDESFKILDSLDRSSNYFPILENKLLKDSGRWKYLDNFGASLTRNSNINNGFTASEVDIYGMTFEVSEDAHPINDVGIRYSYSGTLYRYFKKSSQFRLRGYLSGEDYSGSLADRYSHFIFSDYVLTKKDMFSLSQGSSYWNANEVYNLKSFSYTRKLTNKGNLKMLKFSFGKTKSPINTENNSNFWSIKTFFRMDAGLYTDLEYTSNRTDFESSSYSGLSFASYKKFEIQHFKFIPFLELEKRHYKGQFFSYGKKRSYQKINLGLTVISNQFENLKFKFTTDIFKSNIPVFDNRINVFAIEYLF